MPTNPSTQKTCYKTGQKTETNKKHPSQHLTNNEKPRNQIQKIILKSNIRDPKTTHKINMEKSSTDLHSTFKIEL
jgi:hypothetical protein